MSQLNRNASYLYTVDGLTVWERLRVIRNFIVDREQALELSELEFDKTEEDLANLAPDSYEFKKIMITHRQSKNLIQDCKNELEFLNQLEEKLAFEAEKTRVEGKTDMDMYELNYFEELIQKHILEAKAEILSLGHISPQTMKMLIQNPASLDRAVTLNLITEQAKDAVKQLQSPIMSSIPMLENK